MRLLLLLCAGSLMIASVNVFAKDDEAINAEALKQTQAVLTDPALRDKDGKVNLQSAETQQKIKALAKQTGASEEQIYALSSSIFGDIAKKTNGDPAAITKLLEEAAQNPAAFADSWTPEQKAKLRELASEADKKK